MDFLKKIFRKEKEIAIEKKMLLNYLSPSSSIVEAGVCDGADTEEFAQNFPSGNIYGFECLPHYYQMAERRLEQYRNVTLYKYALSDSCDELDFYVSTRHGEYSASSSILQPKLHKEVHPEVLFENKIRVQAITLDEWARKYNIGSIDFLWLDLQGAELKALQGASKMLEGVKGIFTEVSLIETYQGAPLYRDLKSFLYSKGFKTEKEFLPYKDMGNVLFIK